MIISKRQMQKIAEEIGAIIQKNVNIMDKNGIIIASTDSERIGSKHYGAEKIINENLEQLIIRENDNYLGTKDGINLPLQINNEIVGVVGITGKMEEVGTLGTVIKKMTEILIIEVQKENQRKSRDDIKNNFAIELLYGENAKNLKSGSELLNIRLDIDRIVSVTEVSLNNDEQNEMIQQELYEKIGVKIRHDLENNRQQFVLNVGSRIICFYAASSPALIRNKHKELKNIIEPQYNCTLYTGIGTCGSEITSIRKSFREAELACGLSKRLHGEPIIYTDTDVRMLLGTIPEKTRKRFTEQVFKNIPEDKFEEVLDCLQCYINNNGSVIATAEALFIHKNTLQYRLSKIKSYTGYDPRIMEESIPLYLAMYIHSFS